MSCVENISILVDDVYHPIDVSVDSGESGISAETLNNNFIFPIELQSDSIGIPMSIESSVTCIPFSVYDGSGHGDIPTYEGPYMVQPDSLIHTLHTNGYYMADDVIVYAAPMDIPTYEGPYVVTPGDTQQILETNGYYMNGNVIIYAITAMTDPEVRAAVDIGWR